MCILKTNGDYFEKFKDFIAVIEMQSKYKIKTFWSDYGGEFVSKTFNHFLKNHGIEKRTSMPQQNKLAKHANCSIVEMTRTS